MIQTIEAIGGVLTLGGDRIQYELPEDAGSMIGVLLQYRDEVFRVLREREQTDGCYVHQSQANWWTRPDSSQVCGKYHPDPYAVALRKTTLSEPPPMPKGVRLLQWAPKAPPVAIESWSVVTDVPQFIQTTLGQLQAAMAGETWLAGNWSVRELVDRLEQVGVKADVAAE